MMAPVRETEEREGAEVTEGRDGTEAQVHHPVTTTHAGSNRAKRSWASLITVNRARVIRVGIGIRVPIRWIGTGTLDPAEIRVGILVRKDGINNMGDLIDDMTRRYSSSSRASIKEAGMTVHLTGIEIETNSKLL